MPVGHSYSVPSERLYLAVLTEEAAAAKIPLARVLSRCQRWKVARVRQRAWVRLREAGYGPAGIGRRAGYHYSTVIHAFESVDRREGASR